MNTNRVPGGTMDQKTNICFHPDASSKKINVFWNLAFTRTWSIVKLQIEIFAYFHAQLYKRTWVRYLRCQIIKSSLYNVVPKTILISTFELREAREDSSSHVRVASSVNKRENFFGGQSSFLVMTSHQQSKCCFFY